MCDYSGIDKLCRPATPYHQKNSPAVHSPYGAVQSSAHKQLASGASLSHASAYRRACLAGWLAESNVSHFSRPFVRRRHWLG
ncbi:hypothetical protein L873DRAFT_907030 [Choiromyces venosus 120613-1]|uniref:Uncharacterized protein n=1 Tax=Choiromyces venosus 120613-1 TaxID=1336337 RepID=A0A3N4JMS9_9PEZI|nr:hypothetical protein L873DRAFT_907030 [Choiromyces venosus 120613-1]